MIGEQFGVSQPTISRAIKAMTDAIVQALKDLLFTAEEVPEGCDFCLDGTLFSCWSWRNLLRGSHAIPDEVKEMFAKEFATNDTWKNFGAVKNGRVYDLDYNLFGMSAKFNYPEALEALEEILYGKVAE